ncbi:unnamed protein product [Pedinophyceae sp. YPF-701]|nr:unnamed protein product [Pedinophyceae sp. YPF-701]
MEGALEAAGHRADRMGRTRAAARRRGLSPEGNGAVDASQEPRMKTKRRTRSASSNSPSRFRPAEVAAVVFGAGGMRDMVATAIFVLSSSTLGDASQYLSDATGLGVVLSGIVLTILLLLVIMEPICYLLNGANFNPLINIAHYAAGHGNLTLIGHVGCVGFQCLGGAIGVVLAYTLIPESFHGNFGAWSNGVAQGATLAAGATCEFLLGLLLNLLLFYAESCRSKWAQRWLPLLSTFCWTVIGVEFTGPSINPAVKWGWWVLQDGHSTGEHVAVFWVAPLAGSALAGYVWRWRQQGTANPPKLGLLEKLVGSDRARRARRKAR